MTENKISGTIILTRRGLPDDLADQYDKLATQLDVESKLSGVIKNRIILKWLLEGAKNG